MAHEIKNKTHLYLLLKLMRKNSLEKIVSHGKSWAMNDAIDIFEEALLLGLDILSQI